MTACLLLSRDAAALAEYEKAVARIRGDDFDFHRRRLLRQKAAVAVLAIYEKGTRRSSATVLDDDPTRGISVSSNSTSINQDPSQSYSAQNDTTAPEDITSFDIFSPNTPESAEIIYLFTSPKASITHNNSMDEKEKAIKTASDLHSRVYPKEIVQRALESVQEV